MWQSLGDFLLDCLKSLVLWVVLFAVGFTVLMFLIGKLAQWQNKKQTTQAVVAAPRVETPETLAAIQELLKLLSNNEPQINLDIEELTSESKLSFAGKWLPDIHMTSEEEYTWWDIMIFLLDACGYLSCNDWKFSFEDAIGNFQRVLQQYDLPPTVFDAFKEKDQMIDPAEFSRLADCLPEGYELAVIDTGGDEYVLTIGPTERIEQATALAAAMEKPRYIKGITIIE